MKTTKAREFLKTKFKPEYHNYIDTQLAGDFAYQLAEIIAKPDPEPVAWVNAITGDFTFDNKSHTVSWAPLYISPPKREPLSNYEIEKISNIIDESANSDNSFEE